MPRLSNVKSQFDVEIFYGKQGFYRPFDEVSPVVRTLAKDQFDDYVKRVRLFASPAVIDTLRELNDLPGLLQDAAEPGLITVLTIIASNATY